ncbi:Ldh family oxidoreductase [Marinomonas sp. 2405UD68-3]|uniref:Ldh family oxidoreductase n=1 Tax=Marinomonas sp. 2405UD68-3 TaxID=3391835 RepID=UPI0039C8D1FB
MTTRIKIEELHALAFNKLHQAGYPKDVAQQVTDVLIHADSRGVHSHGVIRVEHYCHRLSQGGMKPDAKSTIERIAPSVAILDGDDGMGHCAMIDATKEAISIAKENAVGFVSVKNTSHCGALSYFAEMAAKQGLISISMTQTDTCVAPYGGAERFWGTNPIAFGFPVENGNPVIIDMATSATAFGKLLHAKETGSDISLGLAIDKDGVETTNPHEATTLLPFGQHKGSGIALAIDALTGMLMGANFSNHIVRMYDDYDKMRKLASLMIVIDPSKFGGHSFASMMAQMVSELHQVKPAPGFDQVVAPNEPQVAYFEACQKQGIPVTDSIYQYLTNH